jgi:hypothetical protein
VLVFRGIVGSQRLLEQTQDGANLLDALPSLVDRVLIRLRAVQLTQGRGKFFANQSP